jgi:putative phosphoserine phosphatase/1-acylglycerol-3-phosphate O-acyltransferase
MVEVHWPKAITHNKVRSALVPATMPLAVLAALPVLLLSRSRRRAINFATGLWADMSSALIGLHVELTGEEHLRSPRPAVFILNHQSNADGHLVAKLIRSDIAYLGKAELSKQRIRTRLMQWGGLILVDRSDPTRASNAASAMIEAIRKDRLSAAIFPEGRRSHSTQLGRFKKGAFLIAMRTRVPLIPIVIHNSIDAQPKGQSYFCPATVRVEVLPPIDTRQWSMKTLDQHIDDVVIQFRRALGQEQS